MDMDRAGIIGYGAMGSAFAARLVAAGVHPLVYDIAEAATARAKEDGLEAAASSADLAARCDVIGVIVRTAEEIRDAVLGQGGIVDGAREGTIVILHTTVLPESTFAIAAALEERGMWALDACPTGVPAVVRQGGVIFLAGGDDDLVGTVRPHLLRIGKEVIHLGPLGAGNVGKLVKNFVTASERLVIDEGLQMGEAMGLNPGQALEMLRAASRGRVPVLDRWELLAHHVGSVADIPLAAELGRRGGLDLPVTAALERSAKLLIEREHGRKKY